MIWDACLIHNFFEDSKLPYFCSARVLLEHFSHKNPQGWLLILSAEATRISECLFITVSVGAAFCMALQPLQPCGQTCSNLVLGFNSPHSFSEGLGYPYCVLSAIKQCIGCPRQAGDWYYWRGASRGVALRTTLSSLQLWFCTTTAVH